MQPLQQCNIVIPCCCVQAIKQQVQLGVTEGLGKLYSNLAACFLQQEHFSKAIQACQLALQVRLSPGQLCVGS